ncbi:DUF2779 domain-containing protein [Mycoplasma sp. T363T]|uniref:DUF2779 domain-containing protein n=1 Tax=Mycoplasma bradburyae TaxID=2963128 RepID=UPI00234283A2|nr:DUF2779 domain-containing protein [Mycoplasma bradburyae]MDC4163105.1 DUF2779 domain-containing protein [Mycoplasma bradburyae]
MENKKIFKRNDFLNTFSRPKSLWKFTDKEITAIIQNELGLSKDSYEDINEELNGEESAILDFDEIDFVNDDIESQQINDAYLAEIIKLKEKSKEFIKHEVLSDLYDDEWKNAELEFSKGVYQEYDIDYIDVIDNKEKEKLVRIIDLSDYQKLPITTAESLHEIIKKHDFSSLKLLVLDGIYFNEKQRYYLQSSVSGCLFYKHNDDRIKLDVYTSKNSTSTKRKDLVNFYYDYRILTELGYDVLKWNVVLVKYCLNKKNEVDFVSTEIVNCNKGGSNLPDKIKKEFSKEQFFHSSFIKAKQDIRISGNQELIADYPQHNLKTGSFCNALKMMSFQILESEEKEAYKFQTNYFLEVRNAFDNIFDEMIDIKDTNVGKIELSNAYFGDFYKNPNDSMIRYTLGKKVFEPFLLSGNVYSINKFFDKNGNLVFPLVNKDGEKFKISDFIKYINANPPPKPIKYLSVFSKAYIPSIVESYVNPNTHQAFAKLKNKKVYFDFESICHLFAPMDDILPNMQIITQNSFIIDHNDGSELVCVNDVIDPLKLDINWFIKIIKDLHQGPDYSYVVYNATFERSRLYEIGAYIERCKKLYPEKFSDPSDLEIDFLQKVKEIDANLFDLADFFNLNKDLIVINSLNGYYSIKKVLLLTSQEQRKEAKAVDYATLNVKRGDIAQKLTAKRFLGLVDDKEWEEIATDLATYCENDVRSMIAVEYFIRDLLKR